jgi:EmrB/QacA subfamily drug resistance transporter
VNDTLHRRRASPWSAFSAVAVGTFMSTLDGSIVNVALPSVRAAFGASIAGVGWVVTIYLLAISASLLAAGRLGDIAGHRRVYVAGMLLFTLGSALCGLAPSLPALVLARAAQALGAAAMMAMAPAAVTAAFPREQRGRALGGIASVVAAGLTAGPPLGGLLVASFSWRAIFYVNLPVGLAGAIWASRTLPGGAAAPGARFDRWGAAGFAAVLASLVGAIQLAPAVGARAALPLAGSAACAALLARHERRQRSPLVDAALFGNPLYAWGLAAGMLSYVAMFSQTFLTPFYLSQVKGLSAGQLGLMLTAVPITLAVVAPISGRLSDRHGSRWLCLGGMALLALGLGSLALSGRGDSLASLAGRLSLAGAGMGLFQSPNNSAIMGTLPRERLGSGGGTLATARNLGMVLGVALSGALFAARSRAGGPDAFLAGYRLALGMGAAVAVAAGLLSLVRGRRTSRDGGAHPRRDAPTG